MIPSVACEWRLPAATERGRVCLYCGFGARRSHLTLHWMSAQGSVGLRWGTITGPYHANFSQVETQKFDPHWFYCLQWGCNNLFCQECMSNFSYFPLEWPICSIKNTQKVEKIQDRGLRIVLNDYQSDYKTLLEISGREVMHISRRKSLHVWTIPVLV